MKRLSVYLNEGDNGVKSHCWATLASQIVSHEYTVVAAARGSVQRTRTLIRYPPTPPLPITHTCPHHQCVRVPLVRLEANCDALEMSQDGGSSVGTLAGVDKRLGAPTGAPPPSLPPPTHPPAAAAAARTSGLAAPGLSLGPLLSAPYTPADLEAGGLARTH